MTVGKSKETLGQRLAQTVAEGTNINTTECTEHTEWVEPKTFRGGIAPFAGDKKK